MGFGRRASRKRLGEVLLDEGLITEQQLSVAVEAQQTGGGLLGEILVEMGLVSERDIARAVAVQNACPYLNVFTHFISKEMVTLFPEPFLWQHQFLPLDRFRNTITIVCAAMLSEAAVRQIQEMTGCSVAAFVGSASEIRSALTAHCPHEAKKATEELSSGHRPPKLAAKQYTESPADATASVQEALDRTFGQSEPLEPEGQEPVTLPSLPARASTTGG
ncbi:MAG: hypothetical protein JXA57_04395 [Armatimonadetes bacterium]|nr:hypothetical protein [Armatimonadota bacterium]